MFSYHHYHIPKVIPILFSSSKMPNTTRKPTTSATKRPPVNARTSKASYSSSNSKVTQSRLNASSSKQLYTTAKSNALTDSSNGPEPQRTAGNDLHLCLPCLTSIHIGSRDHLRRQGAGQRPKALHQWDANQQKTAKERKRKRTEEQNELSSLPDNKMYPAAKKPRNKENEVSIHL